MRSVACDERYATRDLIFDCNIFHGNSFSRLGAGYGAAAQLTTNRLRDSSVLYSSPGGSSMARYNSITFCGFTLPELFSHKERSVYLSNSLAHQALDKPKSFTVDEANVFQVNSEPQSFCQHICGSLT